MQPNKTERIYEPYKSGLTWRSLLGIVYAALVIMPAVIFSNLVTGITMWWTSYVVAYLCVELARLSGKPLTKQEVWVIWSLSAFVGIETVGAIFAGEGVAGSGGMFWHLYFRSLSPVTQSFTAPNGKPLPFAIPDWYAPSPHSDVIQSRTMWGADWIIPVAIFIPLLFLSIKVMDAAMGFICYQLYVIEEDLPFPMQQVNAQVCITLSEREPRRTRIMLITGLMAASYALLLYVFPFAFNQPTIPIPWIDLNLDIERVLPGASFGIATDLTLIASGLILPLPTVIGMFTGSFSLYFIGNHLITQQGIFTDWKPGMDVALTYQRSILRFWAFPQIGFGMAAALIPILLRPKTIGRVFKSLSKLSEAAKEKGILPLWLILLLYLAPATAIFGACVLLTNFPWYLLIVLIYGWTFLSSLISAQASGVSGQMMSIPYLPETMIVASNYKELDIWFAPLFVGGGGASWCNRFKICDLTKTSILSYYKAALLVTPIAWGLSFLYMQLMWTIAPIPSVIYPATSIYWPVQVINRALWMTGQITVGPAFPTIIASLGIGSVIEVARILLHIPFSLISVVVGMVTPIPTTFTIFIGGLAGFVLQHKWGKEQWARDRISIAAGIFLGESIMIVVGVALSMIFRLMWILPY